MSDTKRRYIATRIPIEHFQIENIPTNCISGIYGLFDANGKAYIGSSNDIGKRVRQHQTAIRKGLENRKLANAITDNSNLVCKVLLEFHCETTSSERRQIEKIFINKFGGIENTHNELRIHDEEIKMLISASDENGTIIGEKTFSIKI